MKKTIIKSQKKSLKAMVMKAKSGKFMMLNRTKYIACIFAFPHIYTTSFIKYLPEQCKRIKVLFSDFLKTWLRYFHFIISEILEPSIHLLKNTWKVQY